MCGRHIGRIMIDVSVITPTCESYIRNGKQGKHAADREKQKTDKYDAFARALGYRFVPFVLESYGRVGKQARALLRLLADEHSNDPDVANSFFVHASR
jgi:hypothetical protein